MSPIGRTLILLLSLTLAAYFAEDLVRALASETYVRWKLAPWMLPILLALWIPIRQLSRECNLDVANPLIWTALTYLGPIFVVGSCLFIVIGTTDIPEDMLRKPAQDYPLALLYTAAAILAFGAGVNFAPARRVGIAAGTGLPAWRWSPEMLLLPGLFLLLVGSIMQFANFSTGAIGFQVTDIGHFTALIFFLGLFYNFGQFLLWFAIFSAPRLDWRFIAVGAMMVILLPVFATLAGSRGYLFSSWLIVVLARVTIGRTLTPRTAVFLLTFGALSLLLGIAFGSAFRAIKADTVVGAPSVEKLAELSMRRVTLGEQFEFALAAVTTAATGDMIVRTSRGVAARLNTLTQLAVLVSNRKAVEGKLPSTLSSGILIGLATALIPRALWPDKPVIGDPKSYGAHFFNFSTNSFAVTPFGDLLINFGPLGIVPGMFLLGTLMRILYSALIEQAPGAAGRAGIYALLLSQFSMEGYFGTIIPWLLRTGLIAVLAVLMTAALITRLNALRPSDSWPR